MQVELPDVKADQVVKSAGVQGGDLLWVLSAVAKDLSTTTSKPVSRIETNGAVAAQTAATGKSEEAKAASFGRPDLDLCSASAESRHIETEGNHMASDGSTDPLSSGSEPQPHKRPAWSLAECFALVKDANPGSTHILICALHAALLDTGLEPKWSPQVSACPSLPCRLNSRVLIGTRYCS